VDAQTRHRLIGVFLLLLLAALVTPVIFRSPEQVRVALDMELPDPPEIEALSFSPVVSEDELEDASELIDESREQMADVAEQRVEVIEALNEKKAVEAPQAVQPVAKPAGPQPKAEIKDIVPAGWTLQIAAFSSEDAALSLSKRLRDADYSAYVRKSTKSGDDLYRVFIGPELERKRSEHRREQLIRDIRFKMEGLVVPYSL
jgi:DedD protein|tara:strand:- start:67614 stop:68219 length:606 start_codon:yes stop_codon:yes gene_type:complete